MRHQYVRRRINDTCKLFRSCLICKFPVANGAFPICKRTVRFATGRNGRMISVVGNRMRLLGYDYARNGNFSLSVSKELVAMRAFPILDIALFGARCLLCLVTGKSMLLAITSAAHQSHTHRHYRKQHKKANQESFFHHYSSLSLCADGKLNYPH